MVILFSPKTDSLFKIITSNGVVSEYLFKLKENYAELCVHSLNVGRLSIDLGFENNLPEQAILDLGYAGVFHDIGKIKIPPGIISKQERLTEEEKKILYSHSRLGFKELQDFPHEEVKRIVVSHHEYNRLAYPRRGIDRRRVIREGQERRLNNSPLTLTLTQIINAADIFDALASKRSYKPAFPYEKVKQLLEEQFTGNPEYVEQLLNLW
ncbi:MAG: HD domain-containing phosphohydrolase [Candidatus Woesearchaeota archaeon]